MSNWSAGTIGTVWIGMICAGALPATISRTTKRRTTRLVIRHLARLESPDTEDTQHTVRRVTGRRGRRASVALARHGLSRSVALGGSLSRVHPQQRVDRTLPCPCGLEGADRDEDPRQQAPVALVHHRQPGVEHRQDQQRKSEHGGPVLEPTHREDDAHIHHGGADDPGEKPECLEEAVERGETAHNRERAGDLAGARVERTDVDPSLRHSGTSAGESLSSICIAYMHPEDRVRWRTRLQRGSIEETLSRRR